MSFERYADYALDVPMYFVYRDGRYIDVAGASFRDFLAGKLAQLPGERPTLDDWSDHLTTLFPEVRMKRFLEMRGADGGRWRRICALPAFWIGLLYDQTSLDAAWDLVKDWTAEERQALRDAVPRTALAHTDSAPPRRSRSPARRWPSRGPVCSAARCCDAEGRGRIEIPRADRGHPARRLYAGRGDAARAIEGAWGQQHRAPVHRIRILAAQCVRRAAGTPLRRTCSFDAMVQRQRTGAVRLYSAFVHGAARSTDVHWPGVYVVTRRRCLSRCCCRRRIACARAGWAALLAPSEVTRRPRCRSMCWEAYGACYKSHQQSPALPGAPPALPQQLHPQQEALMRRLIASRPPRLLREFFQVGDHVLAILRVLQAGERHFGARHEAQRRSRGT